MGENARFKNGHRLRRSARVLKTLACRNGFWTSFLRVEMFFGPLLSNGKERVGAF